MSWYRTGTISLTNGSVDVIGVGTAFTSEVRYSDILLVNGKLYEITRAETDTKLKLTEAYIGANIVNSAYAIIRNLTNASNYDLMLKIEGFLTDRQRSMDEFVDWINGLPNTGPNGDGSFPLTDRYGVTVYCKSPKQLEAQVDTLAVTQNTLIDETEAILTDAEARLVAIGNQQTWADQILGYKNAAAASATLAQQWADNNENVAVTTGKYSAKHHATKAAASLADVTTRQNDVIARQTDVTTKQTDVTTKHNNVVSLESATQTAKTSAEAANTSAQTAKTAAETANTAAQSAKAAAETAKTTAQTAETNAAASATAAASSSSSASGFSNTAKDWAEKTTGPVTGTQYSAKYHSQAAQSAKADVETRQSDVISRQSDVTSRQNDVIARQANVVTLEGAATDSKNSAAASATTATTKASEASSSATAAAGSATSAAASQSKASKWADEAENVAVETGKYSAKHHALKAAASATAADTAKSGAEAAKTGAETAKTAAETAKTGAEAARTGAETARTGAETAKTDAETARDQAMAAAASLTGSLSEYGSVDLSSGSYPAMPETAGFWKVTVPGTVGGVDYGVGDTLVYSKNLGQFYKIDNTESVTSVNGKTGAAVLNAADVGALASSGTAVAATKLATARTINGVSFDGTANITVVDATKVASAGSKLTGTLWFEADDYGAGWARGWRFDDGGVSQGGIGGYGLSGGSFTNVYMGVGAAPWSSGNGVRVTSSGVTIEGATNFTGVLTGNGSGLTGVNAATAATATKLATARTISLTGDVTGSASFDGSANASITATVANDSHTHDARYPVLHTEQALAVSAANWVTIAEVPSGRAYGEFLVYDIDSGKHNAVKIIASHAYGQNVVACMGGNRFGTRTIAHVRILYNSADRTYGGAKLQVYCENPTFTLRVRAMMINQIVGWSGWSEMVPVAEGTPLDWVEDSTTRFDDITNTATSFNGSFTGSFSGNLTGNASTTTKLATARTINGVSFDGSANITVTDGTKLPTSGGAISAIKGVISGAGAQGQLEIINGSNSASAAGITFHRGGSYAVNFGLDTDNKLKVGGYSMGTGTSYEIFHDGNASSKSVGAAAKLSTARTINGVSFDGTANISINAEAAINNADSAYGSTVQYLQHSSGGTLYPSASWASGIRMLHNNASGYYTQISCDFHSDNVYLRRNVSGALSGWRRFTLDGEALSLTGGAITGKVSVGNTANRDAGMYGIYDSTKIGHVWSMGTSYAIPADGSTFGNLYGMAYKHTNNATGGTMAGGHQIVVCSNGTAGVALGMAGGIWTSGNVTAYSDIRVKTNIQVIPNALDKVCRLRGVTYERIDRDGERQTGLIAQEVQKVLPEAVSGDDMLSVAYGNLVGLLVEAVKELKGQVDDLKAELQELREVA